MTEWNILKNSMEGSTSSASGNSWSMRLFRSQSSADLAFTAILLFSSIFFYHFRQLPSELAEWNSTETGHMPGSECDLKKKMYVKIFGITSAYTSGAQNHLFSTTS